jgi:hypothetical protein
VGVRLVLWLFERRLLTLFLLAKDIKNTLELHKSCPFSVNVLPSSFGTLSCYVPSGDGFLFLTEPFNLLMNSSELYLFYNFLF